MRIRLLLSGFIFLSLLSNGQNPDIDKLRKEISQHPQQDAYRVDRLNKIADIGNNILPDDERMKLIDEALLISRSIKYNIGEGFALMNLAITGRNRYTREQRDSFLFKADSIAKKTGDERLQGYVLIRIGISKRFGNENDKALSNFLESEKLAINLDDKELLAKSQGAIAEHYEISLSDHLKALEYALKSVDNAEKANSIINLAYNYKNLAVIYTRIGDDENALASYKKAMEATKKLGSGRQLGNLHNSIGIWYVTNKKYPEAVEELKQGLEVGRKNNFSSYDMAFLEGNLSTAYTHLDSFALVAPLAFRALNEFEKSEDIEGMAWCNSMLADVFLKKNMPDSAIYYASRGLKQANETGTIEYMRDNSESLADAYAFKKDFKNAYKYHLDFISYRDSILNTDVKKKAGFLQYKYDLEKKQAQITVLNQEKRIQKIFLISTLIVLLLIIVSVFMLVRNIRHKQEANKILLRQKQLIEQQRDQTNKAMTELQQTQKQLIQSEKMASLGELTAGIAHEIQNPLNFVNNFSEVNKELADELVQEIEKGNHADAKAIAKDIKDNVEKINHHGKRADGIVKNMLQHSRSSSGVKEITNINALADEYLRLSYHGLRAKDKSFNATMKTDFDENIGNINIIPQDIGRVILNLINNAFYVVDEKKKSGIGGYEPTVSVSTKKMNGKVEISVKDNGNGIPQKVLDKIFQPFFTTKPTGQGTGLGLSLSYDIVKAHGGELNVETKEGEGSEFIIILPFL
ncbi:MAG: tetratricopeptide repeat protein [Bacteroidetes bacterium]|nr:MAG: tetratricopeptide repeat protein [Bacteroidota bacterium]